MSLSVDTLNLILYFIQQTGIVFGVGAQTVILVAYLIATRDNIVDPKEEQFGKVVLKLLKLGLLLIIASGALITVIHVLLDQGATVLTPAFLFKWVIIAVLLTTTLTLGKKPYPQSILEGFIGANWFALFVIHVLAPLAAWTDLLVLYAIWSAGFMLAWVALVAGVRAPASPKKARGHEESPNIVIQTPKIFKEEHAAPKPAPAAPAQPVLKQAAPPPPKPVVAKPIPPPAPPVPHKPEELPPPPLPAVVVAVPPKPPAPPPAVPQKPVQQMAQVPVKPMPIKDPDENPGLPAIRVMPKTQQDVDTQMRASSVQF